VTEHGPTVGTGRYDQDRWQLFHTDDDRAEAHDLAAEHPEKVRERAERWVEEAKKYNVLPPNDMAVSGKDLEAFVALEFHVPVPPSGQYLYYPGATEVPERSAAKRPRRVVQGVRRGRLHRRQPGRHLRGRLPVRRRFPVHQGRHAHLRLQLPARD
jgi:hypothetical protein